MNSSITLHRFQLLPSLFLWRIICVVCTVSMACLPQLSIAQSNGGEAETQVKFGLGQIIKLGKWVPILIESHTDKTPTDFEVAVIDGDDTPVVYAGKLLTDNDRPNQFQAWVRMGRTYGDVVLRLFDTNHELIEELKFATSGENKIGELLSSTQAMILTLEPGDTCKRALESSSVVGKRERKRVVASLESTDPLPFNSLGYDEVESIVLVTSDLQRIESMSAKQIDALDAWVKNGGTLILSVAKNASSLLSDSGVLKRFCPGEFIGMGRSDGNRIEAFAESVDQLVGRGVEPLAISQFENVEGRVLIEGSKRDPLVIKRASGLGQIVFVAFDLDSERMTNWSGFGSLIGRLAIQSGSSDEENSAQQNSRGSSVSHYGYEDMVGQLRVPLDAFSKVRFVTFTMVALLVGLYILCIGPGDYFFLRKLLGKMELTWITFPLLSLLFCGLAIGVSWMTRPNSIQLNQLEIIDIDTIDGRVRGSVWTNLYSPSGGTCSIEFDPAHSLGFEIDSEVLSWQGLPGDGLGGMLSTATPSLLKTGYTQEMVIDGQHPTSRIVDLPLQVSSTKPMFGQWWSNNPFPVRSNLKLNPKLRQITGTVKNPFDFTLYNCRLLFENWAYVLDKPLGGGQAFDIVTETDEKNLKSLLTRLARYSEETKQSDNSPWDPTDTRINRIADIMMFYSAAGGDNYSGLTHGYQSFTDMTDLLDSRRAILVGEVRSQGATFKINGENVSDQYDQTITMVRVVLPVRYVAEEDPK